jgi:hypothetical protein
MPKKSKEVLSADAKAKVKERTDDLLDDDPDMDVDYDDAGVLVQTEASKADQRMLTRRRLENYLEERRLQKEIGDDYDF